MTSMSDIEPSTLSLLLTQDQMDQVNGVRIALERLVSSYRKNPDSYSKELLVGVLVSLESALKDVDRNAVRLYETVQKWANQNDNPVTSGTAENKLDSSGGERPAPGLPG